MSNFKVKPYPHQLEALAFRRKLIEKYGSGNMLLLWGLGSGKSKGAIEIAREQYAEKGRLLKTLIITPPVTLFNWRKEFGIHSHIDQKHIHILTNGTANKMKTLRNACMDKVTGIMDRPAILVTNYESFGTTHTVAFEEAIKEWGPELIICDEIHYIKNPKAKRSKAIISIADHCDNKYGLTGTPILNNVTDIYNLFRFIDKGATFGKNFYQFLNVYMYDANAGFKNNSNYFPKLVPRKDKYDEVIDKLQAKSLRVRTQDVLKDLPPLIQETLYVELSAEQKKYYKELERDFITFVESKEKAGEPAAVVAQLAVTKALRLQQLCTGVLRTEEGEDVCLTNIPRIEETRKLLQEIVIEGNNKCILWCSFRANYSQLSRLCDDMDIKHVFITGDESAEEKFANAEKFNSDPETPVVIANRRAGGIGINLIAAAYSIVYSRNFSYGEEEQSTARNWRGGSEIHNTIFKYDLAAINTIEEKVLEALYNKKEISATIVDAVRRK